MKNGYQLEIGWVDRVGKMKRIELRNNSISIIASTLAVAPPSSLPPRWQILFSFM